MPTKTVPQRSEIEKKYTWNAESLFASDAAWEVELICLMDAIATLSAFEGRLAEGPDVLVAALDVMRGLIDRVGKVYTYASFHYAVDLRDQAAAMAAGQAEDVFGRFAAAQAFVDPELLAIGESTLHAWMAAEPRLAMLEHHVEDLFRRQAHVRTAEVEQLIGMLQDPFAGVGQTAGVLRDADFTFAPAVASDGTTVEVTQGSLDGIYAGADREARRTAYASYNGKHLEYKNTLATALTTSIKQNVFAMRVRRHGSTLDMALYKEAIPTEVFHNLIATFRKNLPTWHRYWAVRRKALGVETLHPYDIWAPLTRERAVIPFEQAIDWISDGLAPMGQTYVATLRRGALEQRWVDVYPNQGKSAGAFSGGFQGTHPFIVTNYNGDIFSLSTLAHELGHSMHSYLTWETQPFIYADYPLFLAEVASNFHQAMVRDHLLRTRTDTAFQISVIEEAMDNLHRYFFIMPTLARFELEVHQRIERGQGLSAEGMIDLMADLFAEGYGGEMEFDHDLVGITWATFGHLYIDYYVYQYATGISGANALAQRILTGVPGAVDAYLGFLRSGGSRYPLDTLKAAGVDLRTPEAVEVTFGVLAGMVDRLESLNR
ncbi:MAG: oligoendopeptidase F [Anaerolineae bacterium]|nr:oligoendopeptidase F [Anaerolineae bacterium]